jgi:small subunit ribosomal protein S6
MVIFPLEEDRKKAGNEKLLSDLSAGGATVDKTNEIGARDLAYEINKVRRGHYVLFNIKADPVKIASLDKTFKLNSDLIRYLFVRVEESAE